MRYLDNAATTFPKPMQVISAANNCLKNYSANPGRAGHTLSIKAAEAVYKSRKKCADFFGCDNVENIIFTLNCTTALNFVLKGVLNSGDHVICSCFEHNAVIRPLNALKDIGVEYDVAHAFIDNDDATVNAFEALIKYNTKMIVCTHASNVFGAIMPIERIAKLCKDYGLLFLVDAAQTAGVLPINTKECGIDYLCVATHKGLYSPMGTGVLVANKPIDKTLIEGGTGSMSIMEMQPEILPDRFESGTLNLSGVAAISAGIDFVNSKGINNIYNSELALMQRLYLGLEKNRGVILYTPYPKRKSFVPLISFNVKGMHSEEAAERLNSYGIAVRAGLHCAPLAHKTMGTIGSGTVRVAPSAYTTYNDIEYFLNCTKKITK